MNLIMRWPLLFTLYIFLSACTILADIDSDNPTQIIEHPSKGELEYYGYQRSDPSMYKSVVNGKTFYVQKSAVIPSIQSIFLLENTIINEGDIVLDIGTGSGIQAIFAADKAKKVIATDISVDAVKSTKYNVKQHDLEDKIDVRQGDLFGPVKVNEVFDTVIFNIDYPYDDSAKQLWEVHERFFAQVGKHLKAKGTIFYQAGWIWNIPKIVEMITSNDFYVERMLMVSAKKQNREPIVFTIKRKIKKRNKQSK